MKHVYNWKKDKHDIRDHLYSAPLHLNGPLPESVDLSDLCSPIANQEDLGSCTSHAAVTGAFEFLELKELRDITTTAPTEFGPTFKHGSRLFHYYNERLIEGTVNEDSGASIRDSVKALQKYGVCPEEMWPYIESQFTLKPNKGCYSEASKHKITQYSRVIGVTNMKTVLAQGYPFVIGIYIYTSFESDAVAQTGMVPMPSKGEELLGGHAVCIVGYKTINNVKYFKLRNSWGTDWGLGGYCWIPEEFLGNTSLADDAWVMKR